LDPVSDEAEDAWGALCMPYRLAAERLGFRFIARRRVVEERAAVYFFDIAVDSSRRGIFLEITGELQCDDPSVCRLSTVSACTYVQNEYLLCRVTRGGPVTRGRGSLLVRFLGRWIEAIDRLFLPAFLNRIEVCQPSDLEKLLTLHEQNVFAANGKILVPGPDPLASRRAWEDQIEEEYDDDGVPRSRNG
jgi:hypothetical protein